MLALALATLIGAILQSAAGFGFALVLAPVAIAVLGPDEAVSSLIVLSAFLGVLILLAEGRDPSILGHEVSMLTAWAVPGLGAGVILLAIASLEALQIAVGVVVLAAVLGGVGQPPRALARPAADGPPALGRAGTGLAAGLLTTSTGTSGPPLVLWLSRIGASPTEMRDSLAAAFLALDALAVIALALPGGADLELDAGTTTLLLAATLTGQLFGRAVFVRLDAQWFRRIGFALIVVTGIASVAAGLTS